MPVPSSLCMQVLTTAPSLFPQARTNGTMPVPAPAPERRAPAPGWVGDVRAPAAVSGSGAGEVESTPGFGLMRGIEPRDQAPPATVITLGPGMTMAEIERMAIQAVLRDMGGNRRKAADVLGIGERTLYRKLREYDGGDIEDGGNAESSLDEA